MRQNLHQTRPQSSRGYQRGGAFTFTVLAASMVLLALGGAFMTPARHTLAMNGVQYHKLVAKNLGESGLDWALSQDLKKAQKQNLELGGGKVQVEIKPTSTGALVECVSEPTKSRYRTPFKHKLIATVKRVGGKTSITSVESNFSEEENDDKKKGEKKEGEKKEGEKKEEEKKDDKKKDKRKF